MITVGTTSIPFVEDLSTLANGQGVLVCSPQELAYIKLSSGSASAVVSIYDASTIGGCNPSTKKIHLDCSTTDNDTMIFPNPPAFKNGVFAVLEQGAGFAPWLSVGVIG